MFGLKKFHKYLYGRHFTIITDHKPLVSLFSDKKQVPTTASPRVQRWAVTLRGYEYDIVYRLGRDHDNADALSRLPLPVTTKIAAEETVFLLSEVETSPLTAAQISNWTHRDPVLAHVKEYLLRGWPQGRDDPDLLPYKLKKDELSVQDGCVLWGARVVIPPQGRAQVLDELHETHPGICRMKALARSYVWWPSLEKDLEAVVQTCNTCQIHRNAPASAPLHPWEWPDQPWRRIHIDYAGPFMGKMFLIVVDAHSKWIDAHIMSSTTSGSTINKLREIFAVHGIPEIVISDNGSNFTSEEFAVFMRQNGINHKTTAPYHPSSNGLAERAVQTIEKGLEKMSGDTVATKLQRVLFRYRMTPQSTTGKSPAEMLMGRKLRSRFDLMHPNLQGKIHQKQERMKESHDAHSTERHFKTSDKIYFKNFGYGPKWLSGVIQRMTGPVSYTVLSADGREHRRHVDHIRTRWEDNGTQGQLDTGAPVRVMGTDVSVRSLPTGSNDKSLEAATQANGPELERTPLTGSEEFGSESQDSSGSAQPATTDGLRRSERVRKQPAHLKDYITT